MLSDELLQRALRFIPKNQQTASIRRDILEYLREFTDVVIPNHEAIHFKAFQVLTSLLDRLFEQHRQDFILRLRTNCQTNLANAIRVLELHRYVESQGYNHDDFYNAINHDRHWQYPEFNDGPLPPGLIAC